MRIRAQNVSRRLREAGHVLVFPDRKRDGVTVRQSGADAVAVEASYAGGWPHLPDVTGALVTTLMRYGYAIKMEHWGGTEYARILVTQPTEQPS